jgi:hypothetical protein
MKKVKLFLGRYWQLGLLGIGLLALAGTFYVYGTSSFLPGLSAAEQQTISQTASFSELVKNPLWFPHKILLYVAQSLGFEGTALRYATTPLVLLVLFSFYRITKRFYSHRVSVFTTILFGISATFLTVSRLATPAILLFTWYMFASLALWFRYSHKKRFAPFIFFMICALLLYSPGTIWFFLLLCLWFWKDIPKLFKHLSTPWLIVGGLLGLAVLAPLIYSFIQQPSLIRTWLLLPQDIRPKESLDALQQIPAAFLYSSSLPSAYNLGTLPVLDAFSGTMLLLGLYAYRKKVRLERTIVYIVAFLCSVGLAAINNNQLYLYLCLPFLYLLIGEGISFMLTEWRSVFPRNPIARFVGTVLMSIAVLAACGYHLNRYFLAWMQAPETRAVYAKKVDK